MRSYKTYIILLIMVIAATNSLSTSFGAETLESDEEVLISGQGNSIKGVSLSLGNLDESGRYCYRGIDIAIFSDQEEEGVFRAVSGKIKRIMTDSTEISIDLDTYIEDYEEGINYKIGYRILYSPIGEDYNSIVIADYENGKEGWSILKDESGLELYFNKFNSHDIDTITIDLTKGEVFIDENGQCDISTYAPKEMEGKTIVKEGKTFKIIKKQKTNLELSTESIPQKAKAYSVLQNKSSAYIEWKELQDSNIKETITFNQPGYYEVPVIFDYGSDLTVEEVMQSNIVRKNYKINYIADWISPEVSVEKVIKGQTAVVDKSDDNNPYFEIKVNVEDNLMDEVFYSTDEGQTWELIESETEKTIRFENIECSSEGKLNVLTLMVADVCGNVYETTFNVWGLKE